MERTSKNAQEVALFLSRHAKVDWVRHPSLPENPYHALAEKYLHGGAGGMMSFGIRGTAKDCARFMEKLQLITQETHVADVRSCVLHPASTTHRQLSEADLKAAGVTPTLLRISLGLEDVEDIIDDFNQAFEYVR